MFANGEGTSLGGAPAAQAVTVSLTDFDIAGLQWQGGEQPVLALHGWLDNAASFTPLSEHLCGCQLLAVDLPGHGLSGHRPGTGLAQIFDYVADVYDILALQGWQQVTLIGHSMGAAIALLFAAAFPERVSKMVLIDGLGPLPAPEEQLAAGLRKALLDRDKYRDRVSRGYASFAEAVQARSQGMMPVGEQAARLLCERNLQQQGGRYVWRTDPRLRMASAMRLSEPQVRAALQAISMPLCVILAEQGLVQRSFSARLDALGTAQVHVLPGSHHLHMESAPQVAAIVNKFLLQNNGFATTKEDGSENTGKLEGSE